MDRSLLDRAKWLAVGLGSAYVASFAVHNLLRAGWRTFANDDPPLNPAAHDTDWNEALTWTVLSGVAAGVTRLVVRRHAAATWHNITGAYPPGMEKQ